MYDAGAQPPTLLPVEFKPFGPRYDFLALPLWSQISPPSPSRLAPGIIPSLLSSSPNPFLLSLCLPRRPTASHNMHTRREASPIAHTRTHCPHLDAPLHLSSAHLHLTAAHHSTTNTSVSVALPPVLTPCVPLVPAVPRRAARSRCSRAAAAAMPCARCTSHPNPNPNPNPNPSPSPDANPNPNTDPNPDPNPYFKPGTSCISRGAARHCGCPRRCASDSQTRRYVL